MRRLMLAFVLACATLAAQEPAEAKGEPAEQASEHASEGSTDVWKWANFVILAIGLGYLIVKNLPPFFQSRTKEIQAGIAEAQQLKRDADKRAAEIDAR